MSGTGPFSDDVKQKLVKFDASVQGLVARIKEQLIGDYNASEKLSDDEKKVYAAAVNRINVSTNENELGSRRFTIDIPDDNKFANENDQEAFEEVFEKFREPFREQLNKNNEFTEPFGAIVQAHYQRLGAITEETPEQVAAEAAEVEAPIELTPVPTTVEADPILASEFSSEQVKQVFTISTSEELEHKRKLAECQTIDDYIKLQNDKIKQMSDDLETLEQDQDPENERANIDARNDLTVEIDKIQQELKQLDTSNPESKAKNDLIFLIQKQEAEAYIQIHKEVLRDWDNLYSQNPLPTKNGNIDVEHLVDWRNKFRELIINGDTPSKTWGQVRADIRARLSALVPSVDLEKMLQRMLQNVASSISSAFVSGVNYSLGVYRINKMSAADVRAAATSSNAKDHLSPAYIANRLSRKQVWFMNKDLYKEFEPAQVAEFKVRHFNNWYPRSSSTNILKIFAEAGKLNSINKDVFGKIHSSQFVGLDVSKLSADLTANLNRYQFNKLGAGVKKLPHPEAILGKVLARADKLVFADFIAAHQLTIAQFNDLSRGNKVFTTPQAQAISKSAFSKMIVDNGGFTNVAAKQLSVMLPGQFAFDNLHGKTPAEVADYFNQLTGEQLRAIPSAAFSNLNSDVRNLLDPNVVAQMRSKQMTKFKAAAAADTSGTENVKQQIASIDAYKNMPWITWGLQLAANTALGVRGINAMTPADLKAAAENVLSPRNISRHSGLWVSFINENVLQSFNKKQVGAFKSVHFNTMFAKKGRLLGALTPEQCGDIDPNTFGHIYPSVLATATVEQMSKFKGEQFAQLRTSLHFARNPFNKWNEAQIQAITLAAVPDIPPIVIRRTNSDNVCLFTAEQFNEFTREMFRAIRKAGFAKIEPKKFADLNPDVLATARYEQMKSITKGQASVMSTAQLNAVAAATAKFKLARQLPLIHAIPVDKFAEIPLHVLNGHTLPPGEDGKYPETDSMVTPTFLGSISKDQFKHLVDSGKINQLEKNALQQIAPKAICKQSRADFQKLAPEQFANLAEKQVAAMRVNRPNQALQNITVEQYQGLKSNIKYIAPKSLKLFTRGFECLTKEQVPDLTRKQINVLTAEHFEKSTLEQLLSFTDTQLQEMKTGKLVLLEEMLRLKEVEAREDVREEVYKKHNHNIDEATLLKEIDDLMEKRYPELAARKQIIASGARIHESTMQRVVADVTEMKQTVGNVLYTPIRAAKAIHNVLWSKDNVKVFSAAKLTPKEVEIHKFFKDQGLNVRARHLKTIATSIPGYNNLELIKSILIAHKANPKFTDPSAGTEGANMQSIQMKNVNPAMFCQTAVKSYEAFVAQCKAKDKESSAEAMVNAFIFAQRNPKVPLDKIVDLVVDGTFNKSANDSGTNIWNALKAVKTQSPNTQTTHPGLQYESKVRSAQVAPIVQQEPDPNSDPNNVRRQGMRPGGG